MSRLQTEGANTEAESEVGHHLFFSMINMYFLFLFFFILMFVFTAGKTVRVIRVKKCSVLLRFCTEIIYKFIILTLLYNIDIFILYNLEIILKMISSCIFKLLKSGNLDVLI